MTAISLSDEHKAAILNLDDANIAVCFELVDLGIVEFETNTDDDCFFWLTALGDDLKDELEKL